MTEWTVIGPDQTDVCTHLWKLEPRDHSEYWALVLDEERGYFEFRECVKCGTKQIREQPS